MSQGLTTTFRVLSQTDNEAAVRVLIPALDCSTAPIQEGALQAILARRSLAGGRELLRRLHTIPPRWKKIIRQHPGKMTRTLRDAVLDADRQMCLNGCRAAVWFHEYDLIPTLLNVLEDHAAANADIAASTLLDLVSQLYEELASPRDYSNRRDPQLVRRHVIGSLEASAKRFVTHKRREVIEAFLLLVRRDNVTLKQILQDPHHAAFLVLVDVLSTSARGGVIRLMLSFLDDPHVPSAALAVVGNRSDVKFVQYLLRKIGREPSATVAHNLKRVRAIMWLERVDVFLEKLDDAAQHGMIQFVVTSGISRQEAFSTVQYVLRHGKPGGRREATAVLEQFNGADANNLALEALEDPDPQVQANVLAQLRRRGIPGVLPRLVAMVDSPHAVVRAAARESLSEFTFERFVSTFDSLDDGIRRSTGRLVKKIDPRAMSLLRAEMESKLRTRRLRALEIVQTIEAVGSLEPTIIQLLDDDDHLVRVEAAAALASGTSPDSRLALEEALSDRSEAVREAARKSLHRRARPKKLPAAFSFPRVRPNE